MRPASPESRRPSEPHTKHTSVGNPAGTAGIQEQQFFAAREVAKVDARPGGTTSGTTLRGRERWPLSVRLEQAARDDIEKLGEMPLPTPSGATVQLRELADIKRVVGPSEIQSENGRLRVFVQANVGDRDLGGFVDEIKERIGRDVTLDPGMTVEYSGQYEHQLRARQMQIPNMTHPAAPIGPDESHSITAREYGTKPQFDFAPKGHVELMEALDLVDLEGGARVAGHGFYFLKNEAVLLEQRRRRLEDALERRAAALLLRRLDRGGNVGHDVEARRRTGGRVIPEIEY